MNGEQTEYMQAIEWIAEWCDDPGTTHPENSYLLVRKPAMNTKESNQHDRISHVRHDIYV